MLQKLKAFPPIRQTARIIDLNFARLDQLAQTMSAVQAQQNEAAQDRVRLFEHLDQLLQNMSASQLQQTEAIEDVARLIHGLVNTLKEMGAPKDALGEMSRIAGELAPPRPLPAIRALSEEYGLRNPEALLLQYLYSYLPNRVAVDVGAHRGDVSELLLQSGYETHAFEPFPASFEHLKSRLGGNRAFHCSQTAIGRTDATMDFLIAKDESEQGRYSDETLFNSLLLHSMPGDLRFTDRIPVTVRSIQSLCESGELPGDIGLMKIDVEGYDLEVIRGMGDVRPPAVMVEFWDRKMIFGQDTAMNRLDELVDEMRLLGYWWHIVFSHKDDEPVVAFYCNLRQSVAGSWGNVVFFKDRPLFDEALNWCSATLRRLYFSPNRFAKQS